MSTPSNAVPESRVGSDGITPAVMSAARPMYWSVRRELWENRSIYIAPLVVAVVLVFGFLISAIYEAGRANPEFVFRFPNQSTPIQAPYALAAVVIICTGCLVGVFYCLDALHGERRDRSILFWKSMPVSDVTAVLSKTSIPLVVLPLLTFAIIVVTHLVMLFLHAAVLFVSGGDVEALWTRLPLVQLWILLLYGEAALALWHAPIYAWLLLVSGSARRAAFLWATLPLFAIGVLEKIAFNTTHFASFLCYRCCGWFSLAFTPPRPCCVPNPLTTLTPGRFLSTPGLWTGLAVGVVLLVVLARLRRYRGPI